MERYVNWKPRSRKELLELAGTDFYCLTANYNFYYYNVFYKIKSFNNWFNKKANKEKLKHCIVLVSDNERHFLVAFKKKAIDIYYVYYEEGEPYSKYKYLITKYDKFYKKAKDYRLERDLLESAKTQEINYENSQQISRKTNKLASDWAKSI